VRNVWLRLRSVCRLRGLVPGGFHGAALGVCCAQLRLARPSVMRGGSSWSASHIRFLSGALKWHETFNLMKGRFSKYSRAEEAAC
jgi:hypothetical protein